MELLLERAGDVTVAVLRAEYLDGNSSREFKEKLAAVLHDTNRVVLDLQHVQFLDSAGCGAILSALKRLRESGGDLKICCVTGPVRALFDLVRMHRIVGIYKTRDEAVAAFAA
jgi:anti-sigma B factor antagonist